MAEEGRSGLHRLQRALVRADAQLGNRMDAEERGAGSVGQVDAERLCLLKAAWGKGRVADAV